MDLTTNNDLDIIDCKQALQRSRSIHGENAAHPDIASSLDTLGMAWHSLGNCKKAIEHWKVALAMKKELYGENAAHPDIASSLDNLGMAWHSLGVDKEAIEYLGVALVMKKELYGEDVVHPDIASSLGNLGMVWHSAGEFDIAIAYQERSLEMKKQIYGENAVRQDIVESLNNMASSYSSLKNVEMATKYNEEAIVMKRHLNPDPVKINIQPSFEPSYEETLRTVKKLEIKTTTIYRGRIMLVGQSGTGKTSLAQRLFEKKFEDSTNSTEGIETYNLNISRIKIERGNLHSARDIEEETRNSIYHALAKKIQEIKEQPISRKTDYQENKSLNIQDFPKQEGVDFKQFRKKNETREEQIKKISSRLKNISDEPTYYFSLWDFAGQDIYYITHQVFLSKESIYLVVTDLSQDLNDKKRNYPQEFLTTDRTVKDYLSFWLNQIHTYAPRGKQHEADKQSTLPILIVGTKKDLCSSETIATMESEISKFLADEIGEAIQEHIRNPRGKVSRGSPQIYAITNRATIEGKEDPFCEDIRKQLIEIASENIFKREIPLTWLLLELSLLELQTGSDPIDVIPFDRVVELGNKAGLFDNSEIAKVIWFFHHMGEFIFCPQEKSSSVILNPKWLINMFTTIITTTNRHIRGCKEFRKGILCEELVESVVKETSDYKYTKEILLQKMQDYDIICPTMNANKFFVPSILPLGICENKLKFPSSIPLIFKFKDFFPEGLYYRIVTSCLKRWPQPEKSQLFKYSACLALASPNHDLIINKSKNILEVVLLYKPLRDWESARPETCLFWMREIRDFFQNSISKIISNWMPGLEQPDIGFFHEHKPGSFLKAEEFRGNVYSSPGEKLYKLYGVRNWFCPEEEALISQVEVHSGEGFFQCISDSVEYETCLVSFREEVLNYLGKNSGKYKERLTHETWEGYTIRMNESESVPDPILITATSDYIKKSINVHVITDKSTILSFNKNKYNTLLTIYLIDGEYKLKGHQSNQHQPKHLKLSPVINQTAHGSPVATNLTPAQQQLTAFDTPATGHTNHVVLLCDKWLSSKGGLSTFNRELALHLAESWGPLGWRVSCMLTDTSGAEGEAEKAGVGVYQAPSIPGGDVSSRLFAGIRKLQEGDRPSLVIGHGRVTGLAAHQVHDMYGCKWVQFVHTSPEDLGVTKTGENSVANNENKWEQELELCKGSTVVVGVGPYLQQIFHLGLRGLTKCPPVLEFTPGLNDTLELWQPDTTESSLYTVFIICRGEKEDRDVKGMDIAALAIKELKILNRSMVSKLKLKYVGAKKGQEQDVLKFFKEIGVSENNIHIRSFADQKKVHEDLRSGDLLLMPSRAEGFGLVGLEAISAALTVLISETSGLAMALSNAKIGHDSIVKSSDNPAVEWAKKIEAFLEKPRKVRVEEAKRLRQAYGQHYSWQKACDLLISQI